jgi:hypothetical protein
VKTQENHEPKSGSSSSDELKDSEKASEDMLGAGESCSVELQWEKSLCDGDNAAKSIVLNEVEEFDALFESKFSL